MRRSRKLSNASLYLESDGGYMPRSTYRICGALPTALPLFGWKREFDRVLAGYSVAMPTQWREMDIATHACAIAAPELTSPSFGVVPKTWRSEMAWKAPKIVEVPVGMEINMYACAARK
jgi:coenzyme PQQ precursor peptide PqqA